MENFYASLMNCGHKRIRKFYRIEDEAFCDLSLSPEAINWKPSSFFTQSYILNEAGLLNLVVQIYIFTD